MTVRRQIAFTCLELPAVVFAVVLLAAPLSGLRRVECSKRVFCLGNLRALMACWSMYAEDNGGRIVNGNTSLGAFNKDGSCWAYWPGQPASSQQKSQGLQDGLLFPYCMSEKVYRCPTGQPTEVITYAIVDSMNGYDKIPGAPDPIKNRAQIRNPAGRAVFLDEGRLSPASWTIYYDHELWWDQITARHGGGANLAFADGHGEYWRWRDKRTLDVCNTDYDVWHSTVRFSQPSQAGNVDLRKVQTAVWGKLGYTPAAP